jgi:threonine aldolase
MTGRLVEDHARAKGLADGLRKVPGLIFEMGMPATNMVFFSLAAQVKYTSDEFVERLKERGVRLGATAERSYRLVTHYWIDDEDVEKTVEAFREVLK